MTQKDYLHLAKHLQKPYLKFEGDTAMIETIQAVINALAEDNPKFNTVKFVNLLV